MRVIKAKYAGACYGVQRALDIAEETLGDVGSAYTLGPLIHNPQVVVDLEKRGAKVTDDIADVGAATVIIRSHGVVPEVYDQLAENGATVVDATCPHVSRAQKAAAELGRSGCHVLVVGEAGHPEVMGLCAYARKEHAAVTVVQGADDIPYDVHEPIGVVVQTTQTRETLDEVVCALRMRGIDPIVKNTICSATGRRQKTAAEVASQVDAMVVIGGRNSSNTTRLYEICAKYCDTAFHIESSAELTPAMFVGCSSVGVTAGASTPEEQISSVIHVLEHYPDEIHGARVVAVREGSVADDAGFEPGCVITSIEGHQLTDFLCWQWWSDGAHIDVGYIDLDGDQGTVELTRDYGEDWGFEFDGIIYDDVRTCRNACTFCFMRQLPDGLRPSLSLRDDDFRLSFFTGTFATLTNLSREDEQRIIDQHISPLRVSLHAVDAKVRRDLMGKHAQAGLDALERLLAAGIECDAQIVLVPGVNAGDVLRETLAWAYERPGIVNVGVVPLGYTKYQSIFTHSFDEAAEAQEVLDILKPFQERAQREHGSAWVFAADELYRNAYGSDLLSELPHADLYAACDMYEDGIGIIRSCVDEFAAACESGMVSRVERDLASAQQVALYIAGQAMQPYFGQLIAESDMQRFKPLVVANDFFGGNVNVTGLLCGCDISSAITRDVAASASSPDERLYLIPAVIFNADGLTIDDYSLEDIRRETGAHVFIVSSNPLDYFQQISDISRGKGAE